MDVADLKLFKDKLTIGNCGGIAEAERSCGARVIERRDLGKSFLRVPNRVAIHDCC